jgi:hypothetical protein
LLKEISNASENPQFVEEETDALKAARKKDLADGWKAEPMHARRDKWWLS